MPKLHFCDDRCVCPRCGRQLLYRPESPNICGEHGCPDPECRWSESEHVAALLAARMDAHLDFMFKQGQPEWDNTDYLRDEFEWLGVPRDTLIYRFR